MIDYYDPNIDLTLLGCGFLGNYHIGAIYLLSQIWPQKPYKRICGASCGGLIAALHSSGIKLDKVLDNYMSVINSARSFILNPFQSGSIHDLIITYLEKLLPQEAHQMCNGKLGLSLTNMRTYENNFLKEFKSRQDLIDGLSAGCFIPIWSGSLSCPLYQGAKHADGAYSDNMPKFELTPEERLSVLEGNFNCIKQISVTPFASDVDVSPQNERGFTMLILGTKYKLNWNTFVKTIQAMFPFPTKSYEPFLYAGHDDMKDYLFRNNLIKCQKCYLSITMSERKTVISNNLCNGTTNYDKTKTNNSSNNNNNNNASCCLLCLKILEKVDSLQISPELSKSNREGH